MLTQKNYTTPYKPTWCIGCGNFSIYPATKQALVDLGIEPHRVAMIFGIGCSSNGSNFFNLYSFHGIHGRTLPVAEGVKLSNKDLLVIADAGDGDAYGEGLSHLVTAARGNLDINMFVHDNHLYALTKGQMSPTTPKGTKTKSTPFGSLNQQFNPLATALISGATFVAQGFSGDIPHLTNLLKRAIQHKGFALVNILQVCPTLNKMNTFQWFKERTLKLEPGTHDVANLSSALSVALNTERLPLGVLYQVDRECFHDQLPQLKELSLVKQSIATIDISESLKMYL